MKHIVNDETGMFDQKCSLELWPEDPVTKEEVEKYNRNHDARGRFAATSGGSMSGAAGGEAVFDPNDVPLPPEDMAVNIPMAPEGQYAVTSGEAKALADYVGPEYAFINAYSRNASGPDKEHYEQKAKLIDSLIAKQPPLKGEEIVYRGMNPPKDLAKQLVKGAIIEDKGFMSTTVDREIAKNFGSTTITIRVPKGARMVKVQDYVSGTTAENERESILPRGTKLKITNVHQTAGGLFGMGKKLSIEARVILDE
jgi:hypothetical protein